MRRTKIAKTSIRKLSAKHGIAVVMEQEPGSFPNPALGYAELTFEELSTFAERGISLESLIALHADDSFSFWMCLRSSWYEIQSMRPTKKKKDGVTPNPNFSRSSRS